MSPTTLEPDTGVSVALAKVVAIPVLLLSKERPVA